MARAFSGSLTAQAPGFGAGAHQLMTTQTREGQSLSSEMEQLKPAKSKDGDFRGKWALCTGLVPPRPL